MEKFTLQAIAGLCNRIVALVCCLDYVREKNKIFQLIWKDDGPCPCKFTDIFENHKDIKLVDGVKPDIVAGCFDIGRFQKYIDDATNPPDSFQRGLRCYSLQWSYEIRKEFSSILNELKFKDSILKRTSIPPNTVGFHIRKTDNLFKVEGAERWFDKKIRENIKKNKNIFISSGDPLTITKYKKMYGNNILINDLNWRKDLPKFWSGFRSFKRLTSVEDAAVDLLSLSKCEKVYGSYNSSFSWLSTMFNVIPYEYKEVRWYNSINLRKIRLSLSVRMRKKSKLYGRFVDFVRERERWK